MNIPKIVAESSHTTPEEWKEIPGPKTGVGEESWWNNQRAQLQAYVCIDQGRITVCEVTPFLE